MAKQPKKTQTATQSNRITSAQMSKQEKLSRAFVAITRYKQQAFQAVKAVRQAKYM